MKQFGCRDTCGFSNNKKDKNFQKTLAIATIKRYNTIKKGKDINKIRKFGKRIVGSYTLRIAIRFAIEERGGSARSV